MSERNAELSSGVMSLPWETGTVDTPEALANLFEEKTSEEAPSATDESAPTTEEEVGEEVEAAEEDAPAEGSEEDEPQEGDEDEKEDSPATVKVKVDGEEIEVSLDEALKGYSRTQDYTRKTQKLAEERKAFEVEAATVRAEREHYQQQLQAVQQFLQAQAPPEPEWDKLLKENPAEFAVQKSQWDFRRQQIEAVQAEQQRVAMQQAAEFEKQRDVILQQEAERLLQAIPEWKDTEKANSGKKELVEYAQSMGYTDEQLAQIVDHRVLVMLRKAMMFDRLQAQGSKITEKAEPPKTLKPGTSSPNQQASKRNRNALDKARARLTRTGRVEDAARIFEMLS